MKSKTIVLFFLKSTYIYIITVYINDIKHTFNQSGRFGDNITAV